MAEQNNNSSMLAIGTVLRGAYRIERYLSSGGFGNTYVATNLQFDETVAIKEFFMRDISYRDADSMTVSVSNADASATFQSQLEKFKKEARRLRKLHNPHIVQVHDLFDENGTAYYVMDYIDGMSLRDKLKQLGKPMAEQDVLGILPQILDALEEVHSLGIYHLDLKPANVMLSKDGSVELIDFGASKQQSSSGGVTTSSALSYTNGYAPREQMEQNVDKFGPWTDLYALGATLYTLLADRKPPMPSDIDDDQTPDKHLALPFPSGISEGTRRLVLWMMNTDRHRRPQSVAEIKQYLRGDDTVLTTGKDDTDLTDNVHKKHDYDKADKDKKPDTLTIDEKKLFYSLSAIFGIGLIIFLYSMTWNGIESKIEWAFMSVLVAMYGSIFAAPSIVRRHPWQWTVPLLVYILAFAYYFVFDTPRDFDSYEVVGLALIVALYAPAVIFGKRMKSSWIRILVVVYLFIALFTYGSQIDFW